MIAGICTFDHNFPLVLWNKTVRQSQDTLNMLRTTRTHPKISTYHALEGVHDFNRVPFVPPGGGWTIFNPSEKRGSWEPRALDAWYVGPAYNHYRCWEFRVPATGGHRGRFYPAHCKLPVEWPADKIAREARVLSNSIEEMMD